MEKGAYRKVILLLSPTPRLRRSRIDRRALKATICPSRHSPSQPILAAILLQAAAPRLLNQHRIAVPYLVPRSQGASDLSQPVLWHRDLHCDNISISSTGLITGIIDWQGIAVLPLCLQAKIPQFLEVDADSLLLELPDQFSSMPEPGTTKIWIDYRQSMLQQYYWAVCEILSQRLLKFLMAIP